ncbi:hypothetical protein KC19_2G150900 [Ceratodon purpureus]|uniref:CMP/dCMP-type deaminase domain-containing protein n=1 Tax=Ceratodon purpureus TaxID=3225 RepID=A0A8T0IVU1_CERPU|nr:hypothetical protein KC19_2G150900 [Ceratodon purpureus]
MVVVFVVNFSGSARLKRAMAQDVRTEECVGRQWDVTHIPEELQNASATVSVLAASINPKLASTLIRDLGTKAPLTSLAHVKRIRKIKIEGKEELRIILCLADGDVTSDTLSIPNDVADIVEKHALVPFVTQVSAHPASNRKEWEAQCLHWPTAFHPNACIRGSKLELDEAESETARKFMKEAIYQARLAHGSGQLANGAVVVDPFLGTVIARGHDQCTVITDSSLQPREANETRIRHPLRHAVMEVIGMAADRDRLLFPSNGTTSCTPCTEERSESDAVAEFGSATKKARVDQAIPRPYLCTGFDAYVTREPCAMCAMALVHQRVRRVFFGIPNTFRGALGSKYRLQGIRSLNHHYTVFQVSISESELMEPL